MIKFTIFWLLVIGSCYAQAEKCKSGDTKCIKHYINKVFNEDNQGIPAFNIPRIKPIHGSVLVLKANKNSPVAVNLELHDFDVTFNGNVASAVKLVRFFFLFLNRIFNKVFFTEDLARTSKVPI